MPYTIRKQKCKQSDGDAGSYVLSYTDKSGKKHSNCHTSKKKAQGQIAAIEGQWEADEMGVEEEVMTERLLRNYIQEVIQSDRDLVFEAALTRIEMGKRPWRLNRVVSFISSGTPFKVGKAPPFEEKQITVQITDTETGDILSDSSSLSNKKELSAFNDWIQKGTLSRYSVLPVWDGLVQSWSAVYKDENFRYESPKKGTFAEKSLTPNQLGVAGSKMTPVSLASSVKKTLATNFDTSTAEVLSTLVDDALKVRKAGSSTEEINFSISKSAKNALSNMSENDKKSIIKDFGEIIASIATARALGYNTVSFPSSISNPLTDFTLHKSDEDKNFSVKGLSGSGAALKNYTDALAVFASSRGKNSKVRSAANSVIKATSGRLPLHDAVLVIARSGALKDEAEVQETLAKIRDVLKIGVDFSSEDIISTIQAAPLSKVKMLLKKYYSMGLPASPRASIDDIMSAGVTVDLIKSLFIYPVLRAVINAMNREDSAFKAAIAGAMNSMSVSQAYINFDNMRTPSAINISIASFSSVTPDAVKFVTKAGATTFKQGGIGVAIR